MWGEFLFGTYRTYRVFVGAAVLVGLIAVLWTGRRAGLSPWRLGLFVLALAFGAIAGAKIWGLVEEDAFERVYWSNLIGGFRYPGALLGLALTAPLAKLLLPKVSLLALADLIAPAIGACEAVSRIGCFLAGCCFGTVCDLPWAVRFPEDSPAYRHQLLHRLHTGGAESLPVHPLQLYFMLVGLLLALYCWRLQRRKAYDGQVILAFVALHEWGKFFLEFFRFPSAPEGGVYLQLASLCLALLATSLLAVIAWSGQRPARLQLTSRQGA